MLFLADTPKNTPKLCRLLKFSTSLFKSSLRSYLRADDQPAGCGQAMLSAAHPSLLSRMSFDEAAIVTTKICSTWAS